MIIALIIQSEVYANSIIISSFEVDEVIISKGKINNLAIAPNAQGIAVVITELYRDNSEDTVYDEEIRWWLWDGQSGTWSAPKPSEKIGTLSWLSDGSLFIADGGEYSRHVQNIWWTIKPDKKNIQSCHETFSPENALAHDMRGIYSV